VPLPFVKMHGAGNDFIMLDGRHPINIDLPVFARNACDRHVGIGADGVIVLRLSVIADYKMEYLNADGSETVCGNGMRCLARFIAKLGLLPPQSKRLSLETAAGVVVVEVIGRGERSRVDMGAPIIEGSRIPTAEKGEHLRKIIEVDNKNFVISAIGMGNPHCVSFVDQLNRAEMLRL
jgi:diaminopimelate epimerase